jgi:RNA polymerase sigma-70 factor, ECF subfamily
MTLPAATSLDPAISDQDLARSVAGGNEAAMRLLMRRHNQTLYRTARSILHDDAEAEDAVQDGYLSAFRSIGNFRGDARLSTWLTRIVVNESLGRLRKSRHGAQVIPMDGDAGVALAVAETMMNQESPHQPEQEAMRAQSRKLIESKIDELPDAFRTVFVLRAVEEMSVDEVATSLGIPEATVRTRFFRARALLRESLARDTDKALASAFSFAGARCDRIVERVIACLHEQPSRGE